MANAPEAEIRMIIVGKTGSGKSTTGNVLVGLSNQEGFTAGPEWDAVTKICESKCFKHENKLASIVDVPGFLYLNVSAEDMRQELSRCIEMTIPGIHALLYTIRVGRYKEEDMIAMEQFLQHFGYGVKKYVIIVFTGKDDLDADNKSTKECLATVPTNLKKFLGDIKERYIFTNNRGTSNEKEDFKRRLMTKVDEMVKANGNRCYTNEMYQEAVENMRREEKKRKRKEDIKEVIDMAVNALIKVASGVNMIKNIAVGAARAVGVIGSGVAVVVLGIAAFYSRFR